jgi:hypothetical protein
MSMVEEQSIYIATDKALEAIFGGDKKKLSFLEKTGGRKGQWQASGSIYWQAAQRVECCNKSGHGSGRRRGASHAPGHTHRKSMRLKECLLPSRLGTGANPKRQAACCTEEEGAHHETSYVDATSVARRLRLCCSSGSHSC